MASNVNSNLPHSVGNTNTTTDVSLLPCKHKVEKVFAERHYGPMVDGVCTLKGKECVVCKTPIEGWNQGDSVISIVLEAPNTPVNFIGPRSIKEPTEDLGSQLYHLGSYGSGKGLLEKMHDDFYGW